MELVSQWPSHYISSAIISVSLPGAAGITGMGTTTFAELVKNGLLTVGGGGGNTFMSTIT